MRPSPNRTALGKAGEEKAAKLLEGAGYTVRRFEDPISPFDLLAEKDGRTLGLNVKAGADAFTFKMTNYKRMLEVLEVFKSNVIPGFLLLVGDEAAIFTLKRRVRPDPTV